MENLKKRTHVTDEQLDQVLDDNVDFDILSGKIINYRSYRPYLGLSETEVLEIEQNPHLAYSRRLKVAHVLKKWHSKNPSKATYRALVEVALKIEEGKDAEEICKLCAASENQGKSHAEFNLL